MADKKFLVGINVDGNITGAQIKGDLVSVDKGSLNSTFYIQAAGLEGFILSGSEYPLLSSNLLTNQTIQDHVEGPSSLGTYATCQWAYEYLENDLGLPASDDYILSSTSLGVRSWVPLPNDDLKQDKLMTDFVVTSSYSTIDADSAKTAIVQTGGTITLDSSTVSTGFVLQIFNDRATDTTLLAAPGDIIKGFNTGLAEGYFAYALYLGVNTWAVTVGGASGGGSATDVVSNDVTGEPTGADPVLKLLSLTQAEYDQGVLDGKIFSTTQYIITDATGGASSDVVSNSVTGEPTGADPVLKLISLTQAEYDQGIIDDKIQDTTEYIITDADYIYEPLLNNPGTDGHILSSTIAGVRSWIPPVSGGATDLGYTASPTDGIVTSNTGANATLPLATGVNAGLLAPADYTILQGTIGDAVLASTQTFTQLNTFNKTGGGISTSSGFRVTHGGTVSADLTITAVNAPADGWVIGAGDIPLVTSVNLSSAEIDGAGDVAIPNVKWVNEAIAASEVSLKNPTLRTISVTTDTLVLADDSKYIRCTSASATTVTVPLNASVAFAIGAQINIRQAGTGQVTIAATGGVTINTEETLLLKQQHSTVTLIKVGTDEWDIMGSLEAA